MAIDEIKQAIHRTNLQMCPWVEFDSPSKDEDIREVFPRIEEDVEMPIEEAIRRIVEHKCIHQRKEPRAIYISKALDMAIKALEQKPRKGQWLRMSDLSEQEDDRYKCSRCGNVIHYTDKMDLYTFNSWCGRCGSDNGRHINYEVEE